MVRKSNNNVLNAGLFQLQGMVYYGTGSVAEPELEPELEPEPWDRQHSGAGA
jgi:hypothetical protein